MYQHTTILQAPIQYKKNAVDMISNRNGNGFKVNPLMLHESKGRMSDHLESKSKDQSVYCMIHHFMSFRNGFKKNNR